MGTLRNDVISFFTRFAKFNFTLYCLLQIKIIIILTQIPIMYFVNYLFQSKLTRKTVLTVKITVFLTCIVLLICIYGFDIGAKIARRCMARSV